MLTFEQLQHSYGRRFLSAGDHGLVINMDDLSPNDATKAARALAKSINAERDNSLFEETKNQTLIGIEDIIPGLTNVLVQYNPLLTTTAELKQLIQPMLATLYHDDGESRHVRIPCCYGGECGPDLDDVARELNLQTDEVVSRHQANTLEVAIMGFLPGLAYMKGVDSSLYLPRRKTPRAHVPALSLGIAMDQTVVYPLTSPGGWNLIGRVPIELFDTRKSDPVLLRPGDKVTFYSIDINEYIKILSDYESGQYVVEIHS